MWCKLQSESEALKAQGDVKSKEISVAPHYEHISSKLNLAQKRRQKSRHTREAPKPLSQTLLANNLTSMC